MKAIQFFAITALGAALFASCSNQEELATGSYPSDNLIRVTAGVNNDMTRGDEATTALTKDFSLTVVNQTNDKYSYANEIFSLSSGTEWTCSNKLLWQNLATPVEIVALYPATAANTFSGVYSKENKSYGTITYGVNPIRAQPMRLTTCSYIITPISNRRMICKAANWISNSIMPSAGLISK